MVLQWIKYDILTPFDAPLYKMVGGTLDNIGRGEQKRYGQSESGVSCFFIGVIFLWILRLSVISLNKNG
jgi:hypothetical protein